MALVGSINVTGQANPEDRYRHGVVIQDPVPPHPPKPTTLHKQANKVICHLSELYIVHSLHDLLALIIYRFVNAISHLGKVVANTPGSRGEFLVSKQSIVIQTDTNSADIWSVISLFLTLKTNISPLSMVTVSKSPSQMSGAWLSGSLGGLGGAGGRGGGGGGGRGTSFFTGGVTGSGSCGESVGLEEGTTTVKVGLGVGSGLPRRSGLLSVGDLGELLVGNEVVGSSSGEGEVGESLLGSSLPGIGGTAGGASVMTGGPSSRKIDRFNVHLNQNDCRLSVLHYYTLHYTYIIYIIHLLYTLYCQK